MTNENALNLHDYALTAAVIHLINSVVLLMLTIFLDNLWNFQAPIQWYQTSNDGCSFTTYTIFNFRFGIAASIFSLLSSFFHIITLIGWRGHVKQIEDVNWIRWLEYSLSAPTMAVSIALLLGIRDVITLMCVFGGIHSVMWAGVYSDQAQNRLNKYHPEDKARKLNIYPVVLSGFWLGFAIILSAIAMGVLSYRPLSSIPFIAWMFIIELLVTFNLFGVWSLFKNSVDTYTYELGYYLLSIISKTLLAYTIVSGGLGNHDWLDRINDASNGIYPTSCAS
jgi:hypothetical protein